ncbi:MAG: calcium/sodium antiporter [Oligoflexales bacterium]|nr:calcium/sodium antiporter [Oligoflexales bacterium]
MTYAVLSILGGFALLAWSADKFVDGAASVSSHAGVPPLIIGMVILGFGTSAPEIIISAIAALDNKSDLALGNALGSNIFNTSLILGIAAIFSPIKITSRLVRREFPLLLGVTLLLGAMLLDEAVSFTDALVLIISFVSLMTWTIRNAKKSWDDSLNPGFKEEIAEQKYSLKWGLVWLFVGLILMVASSRTVVWGSINIAQQLGLSDLIIGLTIVALGTSLPELAASIAATRKGEDDIALGNLVGSNMFNILAVVGIAGLISPMTQISADVLRRDYPMVLGLTVALLLMAAGYKKERVITRYEGLTLVFSCIIYLTYLVRSVI